MQPDESSKPPPDRQATLRAAEYVRMSTAHQQYSTENQADKIREYAQRLDIRNVRNYADEGKSGLLEQAPRDFAGNEWVAAMLESMKSISDERSRGRMMKESNYSSRKLRSRLVAKDEEVCFSMISESVERPSYLRRKPPQGKSQT